MEPEDIEQLLKNAKYKHLSEEALVSYRDSQLGRVGLAMAEAHLRLCLICERRLAFLKEEQEAIEHYVITDKDLALLQEARKKVEPPPRVTDPITTRIRQVTAYFNNLLTAWIMVFSQPAMRGGEDGEVIWEYESEDGLLKARAVAGQDFSLTVHFESTELAWEGIRIRFRLGPFSEEVTLEHPEGSNVVVAKIKIPRRKVAREMNDISIEILQQ
jgi:hypothetical protein